MSRIISPHGPTTILITFDENTGLTTCSILDGMGRTKELPVYQVLAIFAQLITKFLADTADKGGFGRAMPNAGNTGGNTGQNTGTEKQGVPNGGKNE